jgi:anion-transporting  ArsA/GET3 family ATPase
VAAELRERLRDTRICVCTGAGGVGKTTTSAALAVGLAQQGKRVALLTIDPARRLARALERLEGDGGPPGAPPVPGLRGSGGAWRARGTGPKGSGQARGGELHTFRLAVQESFDALLAELEPDEEARQEIVGNRVYRELAFAGAGSHEVAAVLELFALSREAAFDVIVLDTPPARNALDFLDAPARLAGFLDSRAIAMFAAAARLGDTRAGNAPDAGGYGLAVPGGPGGAVAKARALGTRIMGGGTGLLLALFARATGAEMIGELAVFFRVLSRLSDALRERARAVDALLHDPGTAFLIVTSPEPRAVSEARLLHDALQAARMPCAGLIVNLVHASVLAAGDGAADSRLRPTAEALAGPLAGRLRRSLEDLDAVAQRERRSIARLASELADVPQLIVPDFGDDVGEVAALLEVAHRLLG